MNDYQLSNENWVTRLSDGARISTATTPTDPNVNPDFLDYQAWLAAGGVPEPADIVPVTAETIADRRYQAEVAGIAWQGYGIATDRESRALIDQEMLAIDRGTRADGEGWKCLDTSTGSVVFWKASNADFEAMGLAVRLHVRACFDREEELLEALADDTFTPEMMDQGWP